LAWHAGGIKPLTALTLERIADAVLQDGLAREGELWAFARDPHTVLGGLLVVQAWGRRAAEGRRPSPGCPHPTSCRRRRSPSVTIRWISASYDIPARSADSAKSSP
jgi:hypothetical protein